ncbi:MAG: MFS transporter, partial [Muribaculaceae bacterium]|nr:MFS transporter [Muribaculaceae bacterium]
FLAVFLPGFVLPYILKICRQTTLIICSLTMAGGVLLMAVSHSFALTCLAAVLVGFGYGVFQPLIYDKATQIVTIPAKATLALAIVLAANYMSISATPFIVDGLRDLFDPAHASNTFPFILNSTLLAVFTMVVVIFRKSFVFRIDPSYY